MTEAERMMELTSEVHRKVMRVLWECDQDSIETPFDDLKCGPVLDTLYDIAEQIVEIPEIETALVLKMRVEALKKPHVVHDMKMPPLLGNPFPLP